MTALERGQSDVVVRRIDDPRRIARKGGKGAPTAQQPQQPSISPDTLRSRSTARVMEVISEGPIYGLTTIRTSGQVWASVFLDDTPVQDASGNFNFNIKEGSIRYGFPDQDPIPGWPIAEAEFAVGVEMKFNDPVVRRVNSPCSAIRYKIRVQSLFHAEQDGDMTGHSVAYAFDYNINAGGWINAVTEAISGKTTSPYERQVRVQLPFTDADDIIDIRMVRLTPDETFTEFQNRTFFSSYTEIIDGAISYDDTALVSVAVDAEEFQTLPRRSYMIDGVMVDIPTNYDPWTRSYAGDWDGTFYTQWTNNPAWLLYAVLVNKRWGAGNYLDTAAIDKWSFYSAAFWNDNPVPDGTGEVEARFKCNCVLNTRQDAYAAMQAIASNMLATLYYANGTIFLAQDRKLVTPERLFGPADVVGGLFDYASADVRTRFTAAAVSWNNPDDKYEVAVELVQDPTLVSQQGFRETQISYFGCTSRSQAQRFGRWVIYTGQYETEIVSFKVSMENADLRPGQLINISDPSLAGARLAGRLLDNDSPNHVTLDRMPEEMASSPGSWRLIVTVGSGGEPDNKPRLYELAVLAVLPDNVVQISAKPEVLPAGSMWMAHAGFVEATAWRVNAVADRDGSYEVSATEYHVEKWDYVDNGVLIPPPPFTLFPVGPLVPPSNLSWREYIYLDGAGKPQFAVIVSWTASPDARVTRYQLEMSGPEGDYRIYRQLTGIAQEVMAMRHGQWLITLVGIDQLGRRSAVVSLSFAPIGLTERPLPPKNLFITSQGPTSNLMWLPTGEIDVLFFWIKWSPVTDGSATWSRAVTSIAQTDRNTTQITTPTRSGTFMVKSIDSLGQESVDWISAILVEQITDDVHIIDIVEQPDWGGDLGTNFHRSLGNLLLPPPPAPEPVPDNVFPGDRALILNQTPTRLGTYAFQDELDLGIVCNVSMIAIVEGYAAYLGTVMAQWIPLASAVPLAMGVNNTMFTWQPLAIAVPLAMGSEDSDQWDAHIDVRVSQDGSTFGEWTTLKSALLVGRRFQFQLHGTLYDLVTTARIVRAEVWIEIPLRNISGSDVPLDGTGHLTITYATPFLETPTVQITARQGLAPGGNIVITASTPDHFTVEHRNASGAASAAAVSIDYFVQGFGGGIPLALAA